MPRGRTYVRNGSVCHLAIAKGQIEAKVSGSELYTVKISIKTLPAKKWTAIKARCGGQIGSLLELLQGKLSDHVMEVVTDRKDGLFPLPGEMSLHCSCPDWAMMCKHVAAVLYGVGARLDTKPELLFTLRGVNHEELIEADAEQAVAAATSRGKSKRLAAADLEQVFGIELGTESTTEPDAPPVSAGRAFGQRQAAPGDSKNSGFKDESEWNFGQKKTARKSSKIEQSAQGKTIKKAAGKTVQPAAVTAKQGQARAENGNPETGRLTRC